MALSSTRFQRRYRLTRGGDLHAVAREGKRIRTRHLELRIAASLLGHPRVGFIVPKHGQSSVARNRLKRRLREIVRCDVLPVLPPMDLVIRPRREAYTASFAALREQLKACNARLAELIADR